MKKLLVIIPALLLLLIGAGSNALASNTTDALWSGIVRITNNSTAASVVSVNFTANTTILIANGYMNSSGNNTALTMGGADVAYMPGYAGNPWAVFAGSVGANAVVEGQLFMGGTTDMAGKIRYFPGTAGATVADSASLEPSSNFSTSLSGYVDTTAGANKYLVRKVDAFEIVTGNVSGNITANLADTKILLPNGAGDLTGWPILFGAATQWEAVSSNDGDTSYILNNTPAQTSIFNIADVVSSPVAIVNVTVYVYYRNNGADATGNIAIKTLGTVYNAATIVETGSYVLYSEVYTVNPNTGLAWTEAQVNALQIGMRGAVGGGSTQLTYAYAAVTYTTGYKSVSVSGVSSGEMLVTAQSDGTNFWLTAGSSVSSNVTTAAVPNNANDWIFASGGSMPYMEYTEVRVGGTQKGYWEWEYAATFTDQSGNGNTATPSFRTTSSDADVSAELISFSPIAEADAPAYTIDNPPDFITDNITVAGSFTSNTTSSTSPGVAVIVAVAAAGNTPVPFILYLLVGIVLVSLSFGISYLMRSGGSSSLVVKLLLLLGALGTGIAIGIIDDWVLYLFAMLGIGIAFIASNRQFEGTGNTGSNLFGFLIMAWLGLMVVNNILEGAILTEANKTSMNDFLIYQPWNVANWFVLPVPSIRFLTVGLPALMKWDYTVFGGNAQIFTYLMYSISGVVAFMFFTVAMGAAANMFFRSR